MTLTTGRRRVYVYAVDRDACKDDYLSQWLAFTIPPSPIGFVRELYVMGEIAVEEFEQRVEERLAYEEGRVRSFWGD